MGGARSDTKQVNWFRLDGHSLADVNYKWRREKVVVEKKNIAQFDMTEAYLNRSVMIYISGWLSKVSCMFKIWQSSSWNFVRKVDALLSLKGMKFVDRAMPFSCISYLCFLSSQWKKKAEELNVELYSFIRRKCDLSILDFRFHITKIKWFFSVIVPFSLCGRYLT